MPSAMAHYKLEEIDGSPSNQEKESVWHFHSSWSSTPVTVHYTGHAKKIELFRWYLEQHAANDPLDSSKARKAEVELAYVTQLLCSFIPPIGAGSDCVLLDIWAKDELSTCHSIPWELLEGSDFACGRRIMVRRRTKAKDQQIWECPVRVPETFNIAIIAARAEHQEKDYRQAALPLLRLLNHLPDGAPRVKVDFIRPGTFDGLQNYLKAASTHNQKTHLIHFDVHGGLSENSKRAHLDFVDKVKSAKTLATLLRKYDVELAVINACESARADRGLQANLAETFATQGLKAVLAMSYQFNASAVSTFVQDFYTQFLSQSLSFTEAAWFARRALRQKTYRNGRFGLRVKLQDWFVPVVYCSVDSDPIAATSERVNRAQNNQAILPPGAEGLESTSDELQGRDKDVLLLETKLVVNSQNRQGRLLCLDGKLGVGKTTLLRHVQWWWTSTGMVTNTIYFDMTDHQNKTPEQVCKVILDQIGHKIDVNQQSSQQELCSLLSRRPEAPATTLRSPSPRTLLILDHFYTVQWPLPKEALGTNDSVWTEWRSLFLRLSQSAAYTIVASYRWPWLLDFHETSEFPKETIHFLQPRTLCRTDALMQIGCQANANAILANRQDQAHLDIILKWCEPYPPLLPLLGPLVREIGPGRVSEALTIGEDLFCYREFSYRAFKKLALYEKAQRFWNAIPSGSRKQLICLAPFHNYIPRYTESYFRRFARNDLERHMGRLDFIGKYAPNSAAIKAANVQKILPIHLELATRNFLFVKILKGLGLITAEIMTGSNGETVGAEGTLIHSIHPVFSLFLRRQAREQGYLTSPGNKAPSKKSLCLEKTFVEYHEERAIGWIQEHNTGALFWDYSQEMASGRENFITAMEIKLRRPFGTFGYESMPAFLYWCCKTSGLRFRAQSTISPQYVAECLDRALKHVSTGLQRSLSDPEDWSTWFQRGGEMLQLCTWLACYYLENGLNRKKFNELVTKTDNIMASYTKMRQALNVSGFVFAENTEFQSLLTWLKSMRDNQASTSFSLLATLPIPGQDGSIELTAVALGKIHRSVVLIDRLSGISERASSFGYWDLQAKVAEVDSVCADLDNIIVDLAPDWSEFLSSLNSEMLAVVRGLGFDDQDDNVTMPDIAWDDVADTDQIALQPPNYASQIMAAIRDGKSIAKAKEDFNDAWEGWLKQKSRAFGLELLDMYAQIENDTQRSTIEDVSLLSLSILGDWVSADELLDCLLTTKRHCRIEDLNDSDFARLARWHYQKASCAYQLAAWDRCLEHLLNVLQFPSSRASLITRVMFQALMLLVLLQSTAPGKTQSPMSTPEAVYYAMLLAYSSRDEQIYAENGTLLSILLQTASMEGSSTTETLLPIEHELFLKGENKVLKTASSQEILQRIEIMEKLGRKNRNLNLASEYLQKVQSLLTSCGANPRQVFAEAEAHLFHHDRRCGCPFALTPKRNSTGLTNVDALVHSAAWPKFDIKSASELVVRPQLLSVVSLTIVWMQNHFRLEHDSSHEHEREVEILSYLSRWHSVARSEGDVDG